MKFDYWQDFKEDQYYHIYNRTNGGIPLFVNIEDYSLFLSKWERYIAPYFELLAFCLIGNHFHFAAKVKIFDDQIKTNIKKELTKDAEKFLKELCSYDDFLDSQFKRMFHSYSLTYNRINKRTGSLFQPKYKKIALNNLGRIVENICYIHHNPIHHDYSPYYDAWRYSSYKAYISNSSTKIARDLGQQLFIKFGQYVYPNEQISSQNLFQKIHEDYHTDWLLQQKSL
jgi:putative transposase